MNKIRIYHFHNGSGGGVLTVINNLLKYKQHPQIENHVIYTINKETTPHYSKPNLVGVASEKVFYYSSKWNFYYTCRQLSKLLPDEKAVIIAHDWLELGMVSNLGLQNPVVQIIHGNYDYYYNLVLNHKNHVDFHISVSSVTREILIKKDSKFFKTLHFVRFPVFENVYREKSYQILNFAFIVNDLSDKNKQFSYLPVIDSILIKSGILINWHITGSNVNLDTSLLNWLSSDHNRITYYGQLNQQQLYSFFSKVNAMILPSINEGFPISVIEAMKSGIIPFVSHWNGAISDIVINNETGFYIDSLSPERSAEIIIRVLNRPDGLSKISHNGSLVANKYFDPINNTNEYEQIFLKAFHDSKRKIPQKLYGSRLDKPWLPNFITKIIRTYLCN